MKLWAVTCGKLLPNAKISAHLGKIAISKFRCSVCSNNLGEHPVYSRVCEILLEKITCPFSRIQKTLESRDKPSTNNTIYRTLPTPGTYFGPYTLICVRPKTLTSFGEGALLTGAPRPFASAHPSQACSSSFKHNAHMIRRLAQQELVGVTERAVKRVDVHISAGDGRVWTRGDRRKSGTSGG